MTAVSGTFTSSSYFQRELNVAAGLFDFIHGDLGAALGSQAIDGGVASQRAGAAQLEGGAGVLLDGAGVGRVGGLGCPPPSPLPPQPASRDTQRVPVSARDRKRVFFIVVSSFEVVDNYILCT